MNLDSQDILLAVLFGLAALLYSSVGHGGASGYLAAMALMGLSPEVMKPTALATNILVSSIAVIKFYRAGAFSWRLFLPLVCLSIPCAYVGGLLVLPHAIYKPMLGVVLIYAAWYSFRSSQKEQVTLKNASLPLLVVTGAALGLLSGMTGVGGGIFLSPLLLFLRWADTKVISGVAAGFILVNSIAGLLGVASHSPSLPSALPVWACAAMIGGFIGAEYGSKRLRNPVIQKLLALVLVVAGAKMIASV
jgi:uncharacterized protein